MTEENKGLSRRTVVKGAAWSVPVIAAAVATPLAAASNAAAFDVGVTSSCTGNYNLTGLLGLVNGLLPGAGTAVEGLLAGVGLTPFQSRGFAITAVEGTIDANTAFTLSDPAGIIDLDLLPGLVGAGVLQIVTVNATTRTLSLVSDLTEGNSVSIPLTGSAVDLGVTGISTLALVGSDNPSGAGAPNSADLNLISFDTNLGSIIDVSGLGGPLDGLIRLAIAALTITVQLCPGQTDPR